MPTEDLNILFKKFLDNTFTKKEFESLTKQMVKPEYQHFADSAIEYYWKDIESARELAKVDVEIICNQFINEINDD